MDKWETGGLWLFEALEVRYTSWPFGKMYGVEDVKMPDFNGKKGEYVWQIGGYELRIKNGKKTLQMVK